MTLRSGAIGPSRRDVLALAATMIGTGAVTTVGVQVAGATSPVGASPAASPVGYCSLGGASLAGFAAQQPLPVDYLRVSSRMVLDRDMTVPGILVEPGGELVFSPDRDVHVRSSGSVVIQGVLTIRPGAGVTHELTFVDVDEASFVGGGNQVMYGDTGLWLEGAGVLDAHGADKTAWTSARGDLLAGANEIDLHDSTGWEVGDDIAVTPTAAPATASWEQFDRRTVTYVSGTRVGLDRALTHAHPSLTLPSGRVHTAEVLNLTRNVKIGGTEAGRAHVMSLAQRPQSISNVEIHDCGPRDAKFTDRPGQTGFVPGRYGLHFHMLEDSTRGSVVEGVVVRDSGSHAFVPHNSHGITIRDCISHDTLEDAYWWDPDGTFTNDLLLERCVASKTGPGENGGPEHHGNTGFLMFRGHNNIARGCVAVGVSGGSNSSGFHWPGIGQTQGQGFWDFHDNTTHNNKGHGIAVWQNTIETHHPRQFASFHNGFYGFSLGAYGNRYSFTDADLVANGLGAVIVHAVPRSAPMRFTGLRIDQKNLTDDAVTIDPHKKKLGPGDHPMIFENCDIVGYRVAGIGARVPFAHTTSERIDIINCTFSGNELYLTSETSLETLVRLQQPDGQAWEARSIQLPGVHHAGWNASVVSIPAFVPTAITTDSTPSGISTDDGASTAPTRERPASSPQQPRTSNDDTATGDSPDASRSGSGLTDLDVAARPVGIPAGSGGLMTADSLRPLLGVGGLVVVASGMGALAVILRRRMQLAGSETPEAASAPTFAELEGAITLPSGTER